MPARTQTPVLVLLDADNTLFDAKKLYENVLRKTFAVTFPRRDFSKLTLDNPNYSGKNLPQILREIAWAHNITANSFENNKEKLISTGVEVFSEELQADKKKKNGERNFRMLPGAAELLSKLREHNAVVGVITGNPEHTARLALESEGLGKHVSFVLGGHEGNFKVENAKIALRKVLKEKLPEKVVVIGDAPTEANVANQLGFDFIGTATGLHTEQELRRCTPNGTVFPNLSNTEKVLRTIYENQKPLVRLAPNAVRVRKNR